MTELTQASEKLDELGRAFEEFKSANDAKDEEKTRRLNDEMNKITDRLAAITKQSDRIETAMNRPGRGYPGDDAISEETKIFAKFLRRGDRVLSPDEVKLLTIGDDTQAGFLAPSEYVREIIKAIVEFSPIRTIVRVRQTVQKSIEVPKRTGVFAATWVGETESRSETTGLTYGLEEIPVHESTARVHMSNNMLEDSAFDLEAELNEEFAMQFAVAEGAAVVNGNAVKRPEGFMTNGDVASTNSGSAATIADTNGQADGLITLQHAIKSGYARNATWVLNRATLGAVRRLKDANNQYIWAVGLAPGNPNSILADPYIEMVDMPNEAADAFPIAYGDFRRAYILVERIAMSVLVDPFTLNDNNQIKYVARRRVGGQVVLAEAIRKLKCAA